MNNQISVPRDPGIPDATRTTGDFIRDALRRRRERGLRATAKKEQAKRIGQPEASQTLAKPPAPPRPNTDHLGRWFHVDTQAMSIRQLPWPSES